jgi:hypothetical protein
MSTVRTAGEGHLAFTAASFRVQWAASRQSVEQYFFQYGPLLNRLPQCSQWRTLTGAGITLI